ncbi:MAG: hypothetical protein SPG88_13800 [Enterococcus hirae]|nr:hypothetical protein [Methanobrevibacter smithii]MCI6883375.1 hypothetical protein [Lactobacillus johnsonii]MDD7245182.1 hypothetical protein [Methanobrevibacter smithii]MDY5311124.1 hypothetical protein [Enterococcus hirae]
MSEKEELEQIKKDAKEKKLRVELKYAKLAKKRLTDINKIVNPNKLIVDMNDAEYNKFLQVLKKEMDYINQAVNQQNNQQNYQGNQQRQNQQNNRYRHN